tara:strand:+ start:766 stop:1083 length:318 start_codon:yes stop_codon:yes gene_type:complete
MDYGNKKKKIKMAGGGAGGASAERKNMRKGGKFGMPKMMIKKRPMKGPEVPMKMDAEGRRGMEGGGITDKVKLPSKPAKGPASGAVAGVVPYQDYVKKMFGGGKT